MTASILQLAQNHSIGFVLTALVIGIAQALLGILLLTN